MAYYFKIKLNNVSKPPVWREVSVPDDFTFQDLHEVIQSSFGWMGEHLYSFAPKGIRREFTIYDPEYLTYNGDEDGGIDASTEMLSEHFQNVGNTLLYEYDFGDGWVHEVKLIDKKDEKLNIPVCIKGKGACPPEDCGGVYGYERLKQVLAEEPDSKEAIEKQEWLDMCGYCDFDPTYFDLKEVNEELDAIFG